MADARAGDGDGGWMPPDGETPAEFRYCDDPPTGNTVDATPADYLTLLDGLAPGDTLRLAAGTYDGGLPLHDMDGEDGNCIVIEGPATGSPAVFEGSSSRNTVSIDTSSYIVVRNLELDGLGLVGDAVKAEGTSAYAHHIVLENLYIHDHDVDQQIVGISTKCPAWHWVIRGNRIDSAGTGMYLGNSNGDAPFVAGLIENNVVVDTVGYNMQIKHQNPRPSIAGMPTSGMTIVRRNLFSKANGASSGDAARPNVLVGHWPLSGDGVDDVYMIYGNYFHQNPNEALFQGEGNFGLYGNVFVTDTGTAINVQPHNDVPRQVAVFHNTVVANGRGIRVTGEDTNFAQGVVGNAVFSVSGVSGCEPRDNVTDDYAAADGYLVDPSGTIDEVDAHPLADQLDGTAVDVTGFDIYLEYDRDFDGRERDFTYRGAYAGPADS